MITEFGMTTKLPNNFARFRVDLNDRCVALADQNSTIFQSINIVNPPPQGISQPIEPSASTIAKRDAPSSTTCWSELDDTDIRPTANQTLANHLRLQGTNNFITRIGGVKDRIDGQAPQT